MRFSSVSTSVGLSVIIFTICFWLFMRTRLFFVRISFRAYVRWFECVKICSALFLIIWWSHADFTTRLLLIRRRRIRSSWAIAHILHAPLSFSIPFRKHFSSLISFSCYLGITFLLYRESWRFQFTISPCSISEIWSGVSSPPTNINWAPIYHIAPHSRLPESLLCWIWVIKLWIDVVDKQCG